MEKNEQESVEYGIDPEAISRQAKQNLLTGNNEYRKMYKQLQGLDPRRDFVKRSIIETKQRMMESAEIDRLYGIEIAKRKSVKVISSLLLEKDRKEYDRWQELMAGFLFTMDMMDFTVNDINELLARNNIGIKLEKYKEIEAARSLAQKMTGDNLSHSKGWHADMWMDESDRLWEFMKERCAVYRRKVDRKLERLNKDEKRK